MYQMYVCGIQCIHSGYYTVYHTHTSRNLALNLEYHLDTALTNGVIPYPLTI